MRWFWIDRFVAFESGKFASAVKNVSMAEEHLHDHFGGYPVMPATLIIEGVAQTAGILAGEARGFSENVILAKIRSAKFDGFAVPGDQLRYDVTLESIDDRAAVARAEVFKNGSPMGRVELLFSHVNQATRDQGLPERNFVFTETMMAMVRRFGGKGGQAKC